MSTELEDDTEYLFVPVTANELARYIMGDVRAGPSKTQVAAAQSIIDKTGTLYRTVAGFRVAEWQKRTE